MTMAVHPNFELRVDDDAATIRALRSELAAYKAAPFVPRAEYDRVLARLAEQTIDVDALAGRLQDSEDKRLARRVAALESSLAALVKQLERIGGYATSEDQADLREARAVLAEAG